VRIRAAAALLAAVLLACAERAAHGRVSVLLGAGPGSAEEARLVEIVRDAVGGSGGATARSTWAGSSLTGLGAPSGQGLACTPGLGTGAVLLRCAPTGTGTGGSTITVLLSRLGGGYQVSVDQTLTLRGRDTVCAVQARVISAINAQLPGTARADPAGGCPGR
jgi:hypothetical protein